VAVTCACGNLNVSKGDAGSTVAVTGLGFTPTVILFWWSGHAALSTGTRLTSLRGVGAAVSDLSFFAQASYDGDAIGTAIAKHHAATDACIIELDSAGAIVGRADLQSFGPDGFTLEVQAQFTNNLLVSYLAFGGTDSAEIGSFTPAGTAPVTQAVANAGFRPDVTFFFLGEQFNFGADSHSMLGVATAAGEQAVWWGGSNDAAATGASATYCRSGECLAYNPSQPALAPSNRAELVSHDEAGFTINWLERTHLNPFRYLSIKGGQWKVGTLLTQADPATAISLTGLGFTPAGLLLVSAGKPESVQDAVGAAHDQWSMGAATGPQCRVAQQTASRSGNTDMFVHAAARADALYINADPAQAGYTTLGLLDVQSVDPQGFTLIMDDPDPSPAFAFYVAVGNSAAPRHRSSRGGRLSRGWRASR